MKQKIKTFICKRLKENSTWTGLGFLLSVFGCRFAIGLDWEMATGIGIFLAKAIQTFLPDKVGSESSDEN
jgi:hypothetical protein